MQPNGKHTPAAVPKLLCSLLILSASLARSAQAAALAPQLALVALDKGTTLALLTCKGITIIINNNNNNNNNNDETAFQLMMMCKVLSFQNSLFGHGTLDT